ncbi:protein lingerer-like isoform X3 [Dreissena polymorpha]|uniref:protein lingerer-like isoform X3 n=1 Tax=Dreissena polymorpha TaxID=45954 RepID=UPI002264C601|nr:protein lingerer-like isoform X3 [Dreissena polymorpha]
MPSILLRSNRMKNTNGSSRGKAVKEKGNKTANSNHSNTVKSEGPPVKQIQPTAEQLAFNSLIQGKDNDDQEQRQKIKQIIELTGCSQERAEIALFDSKNDLDGAVGSIFEGAADESEWHENVKKKKKQKSEAAAPSLEDSMDLKLDKEGKERIDRENKERNREEKENDRPYREQSDQRRPRRNDNRPPRLSRGRGRPDWGGDRTERDDDSERDEHRERSFSERGRGRGRGGFASRRGGRGGGNFQSTRGGFGKPSHFDNGPQIDTWTNETAVIGEKEPKISNWGDSKDEWNEDIDSWSGSLAESKVFTASTNAAPESQNAVHMDTNAYDMGPLYPKHSQADMDEHAYITQFNQQATESIKNSIGIGSGSSSSLQNSMTSNVSALVSLQQTALHENLGSSLSSELAGNGLTSSGLGRNSLGNSLSNSLPVNSLTGNSLHSGDLTGGSSHSGTSISVSALTSLAGSQGMSSSSAASQSAMMQQRAKPQRSKLPPPSKIPASAVEMPDHMVTNLDVQFGNLEFGFSFGGNESSPSSFTSSETKSTQSLSNHVGGKPSEARMASSLETSPRNSTLYQQSPYTTPTKKSAAESPSKINSPPDPLQMPGSTDLKSNQHLQGQATQVSSSNIDAYSYGSQKTSGGYQPASKPGAYPGSQYQGSNPPSQSPSNQFSSQYRQMNQNQFPAGTQFSTTSQYQAPASAYQASQSGFQGSQSNYHSNQSSQFATPQSQFQNFQSSSTFPNQSTYSSNQSSQNPLYPSSTTSSYTNPSQQNSLYSQSSRQGTYSNQSYLNDHAASAGSTFQASVTQSSSPFKDNQTGASSYRDNMASSKTRDTSADNTSYTRDTNSASSFSSDSQSLAYTRDSQSVGSSYSRDSGSAYNRESKSASGSYPRDSSTSDAGSFSRDSQSSGSSFTGRDSQSSTTGYRDNQSGAPGFGGQAGSYPRETGASQSQSGFSAKSYRNTSEVATTLSNSLTGNKLVEGFSSMAVNDGSLDSRQSTSSQFDVNVSSAKLDASSTVRTSSTTPSSSVPSTTVTSSNTTKISTLHSASTTTSTKAPLNLPPGVPIMAAAQQYILSQAGQMPYFNSNLYDLTNAAAAGIQIPPTTLTANSTQQSLPTVPTVPYTGSADSGKVPRVDAQSPTGTMASTPSAGQAQGSHQQQQPPFILNYSHYYYPPNMIPGSPGFQFPILQMPQVTNSGTPANSQYQQKSYGSHLQYGANKGYEDLSGPSAADFKSPYGSNQAQPKPTANSSVSGSVSSDIPLAGGYAQKNHTQAFDKQAFHTGTPPPFNLPMGGQLATGNQTGPLGAHTGPYGTPFVPMMAHQPHSQMMHHPIQDTSSSSRGGQAGSQSKSSNKGYSGSNWGTY